MSRLGEVWQIGIGFYNGEPYCHWTYLIIAKALGGWTGVIIETPPSCEYLLLTRVLISHDWFLRKNDRISRLA